MARQFTGLKLQGQKGLVRKIRKLSKLAEGKYKRLVIRHTIKMQKVARLGVSRNLGVLAANILTDFSRDGLTGLIDVPDPGEAGEANYGVYLEEGTDPHFPPIEALAFWAKNKFKLSEKESKQVGFLVARKISREGTEAKPFMQPAFDEVSPEFEKDVEKTLDRIVNKGIK